MIKWCPIATWNNYIWQCKNVLDSLYTKPHAMQFYMNGNYVLYETRTM